MRQVETQLDRIVEAARAYGAHYFYPSPVSVAEVAASVRFAEHSYESWLVRVESEDRVLIVTVWLAPDGDIQATHYTAPVSRQHPEERWTSAA